MRYLRASKGTSIVEVLVVMVVLLVGILTIVRLFPPGFMSVRHAESVTFAGRLAQYEIERWKNNSANLPTGVLPIGTDATTGAVVVLNDLYPGPPVDAKNATALRRIIGETVRIPFGGWDTGPVAGSLYLLSFSPIDMSGSGLAVRGGDLSRRVMETTSTPGADPWHQLRPFQYGIDYDDLKICFRPSSGPRVLYLSCSWWETGGGGEPDLHTATDLKLEVPANLEGWIDLPIPKNSPAFIGIDRYSDVVSRGFIEIGAGDPWSPDDPYEYKVIDPTLGIVSFNPLGYAQTEFGRPLEARIDYDILDLEIIREDKRAPAEPPYRINLTLNRIKKSNETLLPDGSAYAGIHPPQIGDDIVAIDLESACKIDLSAANISYKDGAVELPELITLVGQGGATSAVPARGRNIRFFYKAEGDWSLQFHKAYSEYEREYGDEPLDFRSYHISASDPKQLGFSACNANNTIAVDYEYMDEDTGRQRKIVGETHKATDALDRGPGGVESTFIELARTPTRIYSVSGISVRARVIWREGERWRYVDLDSTLTRKEAE